VGAISIANVELALELFFFEKYKFERETGPLLRQQNCQWFDSHQGQTIFKILFGQKMFLFIFFVFLSFLILEKHKINF